MTRVAFNATKSAFEVSDGALVCGVSDDGDMYLMFQRAPEGAEDDDGVYLEHTDQINSGYDCIRQCKLKRTLLSVDLSRQLGRLRDVEGFDVRLDIPDAAYTLLLTGLRRVFRDQTHVLTVA